MSTLASSQPAAPGRIVVGVDGSPSSIGALREAVRLAKALNTDVLAICTWAMLAGYGRDALPADLSFENDAEEALHTAVRKAFGEEVPDGLSMRVMKGSPAHTLIQAARGARMLVVGSRGHGGFAGMLMGSVSSACAEYAQCPVLVYHEAPVDLTRKTEKP